MCTVIVLKDFHPGYPLIIAANRDERYTRPSTGPIRHGHAIYPTDLKRGGTWIGVTDSGWFTAITNQDADLDPNSIGSRGHIVVETLLTEDLNKTSSNLQKLDPENYNPFNLVFGSPSEGVYLHKQHGKCVGHITPLLKGITVISNDCSFNQEYLHKETVINTKLYELSPEDSYLKILDRMHGVLSNHDSNTNPYQSACVHDDSNQFGTVSSSIILIPGQGKPLYYHSEGPACKSTGFVQIT